MEKLRGRGLTHVHSCASVHFAGQAAAGVILPARSLPRTPPAGPAAVWRQLAAAGAREARRRQAHPPPIVRRPRRHAVRQSAHRARPIGEAMSAFRNAASPPNFTSPAGEVGRGSGRVGARYHPGTAPWTKGLTQRRGGAKVGHLAAGAAGGNPAGPRHWRQRQWHPAVRMPS